MELELKKGNKLVEELRAYPQNNPFAHNLTNPVGNVNAYAPWGTQLMLTQI